MIVSAWQCFDPHQCWKASTTANLEHSKQVSSQNNLTGRFWLTLPICENNSFLWVANAAWNRLCHRPDTALKPGATTLWFDNQADTICLRTISKDFNSVERISQPRTDRVMKRSGGNLIVSCLTLPEWEGIWFRYIWLHEWVWDN